jgi:hypothetical protein
MNKKACTFVAGLIAVLIVSSCSGGGSSRVSYGMGVGYGGYYGGGPWRGHSGYPIYVGGGGRPDIPHIPSGPSAVQLPEFGMPDAGMMDMGMMDMGGFDF